MSRFVVAIAVALPLLLSSVARGHDFVDTRLNFTITDENMLVKPGETNPSVPGVRIGQPSALGILFFDNYDTRYSGYENLTHAVIYKKLTLQKFEAEGALVLRLLEVSDISLSSIDAGSYIKVAYYPDASRVSKSNLSLVAFPLSSDRMRLGYSYRISWGGSPIFFKYNPDLPTTAQVPVNPAPAPGAKVQWSSERFAAWFGFKTTLLLNRNPEVNEQEAIYGLLGGVSIDVVKDLFRIDANGGYFYRGTNQNLYSTQVKAANKPFVDYPVATAGGSLQLSLFRGLSPSGSIDYSLYRNDPTSAMQFFKKPEYKPGINWMAQAEVTFTSTSLQSGDVPDTTVRQNALAGDINLRAQIGRARIKLDAVYRSLEFILQNQPSLVPFQAFPKGSLVTPDRFVSLGFDYNIERIGLTLGPTVAIDFPATFTPPPGGSVAQLCGNAGGTLCSSATIVVRGEGDYSILPEKEGSIPVLAGKLVARLDFLEYFAVIFDLYYSHDGNQTALAKDSFGSQVRKFNKPDQLGFNLTLQARF
ncbi:MAG: hypothetical protein EXR72_16240 [Myxococcales bacterium]|nr:hypothetical protein [Myxococcales bacterium]